jgi:quercetin dioxygenase-like cupin family protein
MMMHRVLFAAMCATATTIVAVAGTQSSPAGERAQIVLDNAHVRVYKTRGVSLAGVDHRAGVVITLEDSTSGKTGAARWARDAAEETRGGANPGPLIIVQPRDAPVAAAPADGSKPGEAVFSGMSFTTIFENDKVTAIRARMEVGATEGFHTHASDTVVVHLSGGVIEDTANGKTAVNRWKHGDVEFEARGSSHSARNIGPAVDVVLVALKP